MSPATIHDARKRLMTFDAAKAKLDELTEVFHLAKSEYDRGSATGATWPDLAATGLERLAERLAVVAKWLQYAADNGRLFDDRRIAIEAAKAQLAAAEDVRSMGTPDPKRAVELENAVIAARSSLWHTTGSFPWFPVQGMLNGMSEIERAERSGDRVQYAIGEAASALMSIEAHQLYKQARAHLGILRADATPARRMVSEPLRKTAERLLVHFVDEGLREAFAVVALEELGRYRAACAKFDPDDRNRDGTKRGTPHVDPPEPEELAKHFAAFFEHQEQIDARKAKYAIEERKRIQAEQAAREREMRMRSEFRASRHTSSATFEGERARQADAAPPAFDEAKHAAGAPPMPAPPPAGVQKRTV